jgi:DNA/RNA-binding domain of Phe-tRNA-synthetase-like protein
MMQQITIDTARLPDAGLVSFVAHLAPQPAPRIDPGDWIGGEAAERAIALYKERLRSYGRDPNRYRVSSDALRRRILREPIPTIHPLVDAGNILSLASGWPVGCYDPDAIRGAVTLRLGREGETVETLAKGLFDAVNLPVLADELGIFGSPVSDSVRTRIDTRLTGAHYFLYFYGPIEPAALSEQAETLMRQCGLILKTAITVVR